MRNRESQLPIDGHPGQAGGNRSLRLIFCEFISKSLNIKNQYALPGSRDVKAIRSLGRSKTCPSAIVAPDFTNIIDTTAGKISLQQKIIRIQRNRLRGTQTN